MPGFALAGKRVASRASSGRGMAIREWYCSVYGGQVRTTNIWSASIGQIAVPGGAARPLSADFDKQNRLPGSGCAAAFGLDSARVARTTLSRRKRVD